MNEENLNNDSNNSKLDDIPIPVGGDDNDINISNTGQRIKAIAVVVIIFIAGGIAYYMFNEKQKEIKTYEEVKAAFSIAHTQGYDAFWKKSQIRVEDMRTNKDFTARLTNILGDNPVNYGKHLEENALPVLVKALPLYKTIKAPAEMADSLNAIIKAAEEMKTAWTDFSNNQMELDGFFKSKKKLDKVADEWFGAQQYDDEKYIPNAVRYLNFMKCVLKTGGVSTPVFEIKPSVLSDTILQTCQKVSNRAAWFENVNNDCFPMLMAEAGEPDDIFKATITAYKQEERVDHASKFGIVDCIDKTREQWNEEQIDKIALAWKNYITAKNDLLNTIKNKLEELR